MNPKESEDFHIAIVMPYQALGDLEHAITSGQPDPSPKQILLWLLGICGALNILTIHRIIHRDIKPANVLISDELISGCHPALLADFGQSGRFPESDEPIATTSGSKGFLAPELLSTSLKSWSEKSDVFSFGITAFCLITHTSSYALNDGVGRGAMVGEKIAQTELSSLGPLIVQLCNDNPAQRPPFASVFRELTEIGKANQLIDLEIEAYLEKFDFQLSSGPLCPLSLSFSSADINVVKLLNKLLNGASEVNGTSALNMSDVKLLPLYMRHLVVQNKMGMPERIAHFQSPQAVASVRQYSQGSEILYLRSYIDEETGTEFRLVKIDNQYQMQMFHIGEAPSSHDEPE